MTYRKPCKTCGVLSDKYEAMQAALYNLLHDFFDSAAEPIALILKENFDLVVKEETVRIWLEGRKCTHLSVETEDASVGKSLRKTRRHTPGTP